MNELHSGIQCPKCEEELYSLHRNDFHYCGCGYTFVDGGLEYLRCGYGDPDTGIATHGIPEHIERRVSISVTEEEK